MDQLRVKLHVNGEPIELEVRASETLLETLRERLELTGAKEGCGLGACGSCTVLVDGIAIRSCIVLTAEVQGAEITTIEGLGQERELDPLQQSFMEKGAVQCGFCSPGMILTAKSLLNRNPQPTREEIIRTMSSNVCRCTGYKKIIEAVEAVAQDVEKVQRD